MPSQWDGDEMTLMEGVDQGQVAHLVRAFDIMASKMGTVSNSTALWALATLLAKIMAGCALDQDLLDATGRRFSDMLRAAYPAMVQAVELIQRDADGRPQYDA